jgi:hypothetical protein
VWGKHHLPSSRCPYALCSALQGYPGEWSCFVFPHAHGAAASVQVSYSSGCSAPPSPGGGGGGQGSSGDACAPPLPAAPTLGEAEEHLLAIQLEGVAIGADLLLKVAALSVGGTPGAEADPAAPAAADPWPTVASQASEPTSSAAAAAAAAPPLQLDLQLSHCQVISNAAADPHASGCGVPFASDHDSPLPADALPLPGVPSVSCQAVLEVSHLHLALPPGRDTPAAPTDQAQAPGIGAGQAPAVSAVQLGPQPQLLQATGVRVLLAEGRGSDCVIQALHVPSVTATQGGGGSCGVAVSVPQVRVKLQPSQLAVVSLLAGSKAALWASWAEGGGSGGGSPTPGEPPAAPAQPWAVTLAIGSLQLLACASTELDSALLLDWQQLQAAAGSCPAAAGGGAQGSLTWQDARLLLCSRGLEGPPQAPGGQGERVSSTSLPAVAALARLAGQQRARGAAGQGQPQLWALAPSEGASAGGLRPELSRCGSGLRCPWHGMCIAMMRLGCVCDEPCGDGQGQPGAGCARLGHCVPRQPLPTPHVGCPLPWRRFYSASSASLAHRLTRDSSQAGASASDGAFFSPRSSFHASGSVHSSTSFGFRCALQVPAAWQAPRPHAGSGPTSACCRFHTRPRPRPHPHPQVCLVRAAWVLRTALAG